MVSCSCANEEHKLMLPKWENSKNEMSLHHPALISVCERLAAWVCCKGGQQFLREFPSPSEIFGHQPWPFHEIQEHQQVTQMTHSPFDQVLTVESLFGTLFVDHSLALAPCWYTPKILPRKSGVTTDFRICWDHCAAKSFVCNCFQWYYL